MSSKRAASTPILAIDRKRIFLFVAITYGLSVALYLVVFCSGRGSGSYSNLLTGRMVLMFAPLIAAIATRLMTREGWSNTLLRPDLSRGRWRYYLAAWFLPPAASLAGAAIFYLLSPGHFDPSMAAYRELADTSGGSAMEPWAFFFTQVGIGIIVTPLSLTLLLSFGEEFGWRAYLLPKLVSLGPRKAALLVGVVHGLWHWPSILMGSDYGFRYWGAPVVGPLLFVAMTCVSSTIYAWLILRSGSVWPAAIYHGAFNTSNGLAWIFAGGEPNPVLGPGAQGVIGMLGYAALALVIFLSPRSLAPAAATGSVDPSAAHAAIQPSA